MTQEQIEAMQQQADKMQSAICAFTGIMEARAERAIENHQYEMAEDLLRDLIYVHHQKPLGKSSKVWIKKWVELREMVWQKQANQVPMPM